VITKNKAHVGKIDAKDLKWFNRNFLWIF
jgi:hypothetical protein